jgi:hypothetical protein
MRADIIEIRCGDNGWVSGSDESSMTPVAQLHIQAKGEKRIGLLAGRDIGSLDRLRPPTRSWAAPLTEFQEQGRRLDGSNCGRLSTFAAPSPAALVQLESCNVSWQGFDKTGRTIVKVPLDADWRLGFPLDAAG